VGWCPRVRGRANCAEMQCAGLGRFEEVCPNQSAGSIAQSRKIDWADLPPGPGSDGE